MRFWKIETVEESLRMIGVYLLLMSPENDNLISCK